MLKALWLRFYEKLFICSVDDIFCELVGILNSDMKLINLNLYLILPTSKSRGIIE
jgi:hypothetical protein